MVGLTTWYFSEPVVFGGLAARKWGSNPLAVIFDRYQQNSDDQPPAPPAEEPEPDVQDAFADPTLSSEWQWRVPQSGPMYSLSETPGQLRLIVPQGNTSYYNDPPFADRHPLSG
jgi:hypothetical protein